MIAPFVENLGRLAAVAVIALCDRHRTYHSGASGPFSGLGGQWNGTGHIELYSGTKERVRCRASYRGQRRWPGDAPVAALRQRQL